MSSKYTTNTPYIPKMVFHESLGNTKIGKILNTNLQAGDDFINGRTTVKGSCTGCCDSCSGNCMPDCYARDAYRYDNVIEANGDNTYFAREDIDGFFEACKEALNHHPSFKYHRWHSSGENPSKEYFEKAIDTSEEVSDKQHYMYTKRYDWLNEITDERGGKENMPDNFSVLVSPPFDCDTMEKVLEWSDQNNPNGYPMFIVDQHKDDTIAALPHCPAVDIKGHKTGVTCDQCLRCPNGKTTAVHIH